MAHSDPTFIKIVHVSDLYTPKNQNVQSAVIRPIPRKRFCGWAVGTCDAQIQTTYTPILIFGHVTVTDILICCCVPNFIKTGSRTWLPDADNCWMFNALMLGHNAAQYSKANALIARNINIFTNTNRVINGWRARRADSCSFQVPLTRGQHNTSAIDCCTATVHNAANKRIILTAVSATLSHNDKQQVAVTQSTMQYIVT